MHARSLLVSALWLVTGCFDPAPQPGGACAPGDLCPSPLQCIAAVCLAPGTSVGTPPDAQLPDAPSPPVMCPAGYSRVATGSCHRSFLNMPLSWPLAEARCEEDGAHLVIPDSLEEAKLLPERAWLGISDRRLADRFITVTGRPLAFAYWEDGEPAGSLFSCAQVGSGTAARWQTGPCELPFSFVCEADGVKADPAAY